jgi:hypothetical protein
MTDVFRRFVSAVAGRKGYYGSLMQRNAFAGIDGKHLKRIRRMNGRTRARYIIGQLWHCTDIMPLGTCDNLRLPQGSSYAQGARRLRWRLWYEISAPTFQQVRLANQIIELHEKQGMSLWDVAEKLGLTRAQVRAGYWFLARWTRTGDLIITKLAKLLDLPSGHFVRE